MKKKLLVGECSLRAALRWLSLFLLLLWTSSAVIAGVQSDEADDAQKRAQQTYGPIQAPDTLWLIANRFHPDRSVTIYQTMAAIMAANPDAFPSESIHDLRSGYVLHIPSSDRIREVHAEEAFHLIVPQLGGLIPERRSLQQTVPLAEHEEQVMALQTSLAEAQQNATRMALDNESMQLRLRALETALFDVQTQLELSMALEQETAQTLRTVLEEYQQSREVIATPGVQMHPMLEWPGILILVALLVLCFFAYRGLTRSSQAKDVVVGGEKPDVPQVELPAVSAQSAQPVTKTAVAFREIDDILAEAERDADPDSDVDAGQTDTEKADYMREQLAAQLDLARAYIEMGDFVEARATIDEVMATADAELRQEALALLARVKDAE